jgi:hypothetical protein
MSPLLQQLRCRLFSGRVVQHFQQLRRDGFYLGLVFDQPFHSRSKVAKVFVEEGESAKTADRTELKALLKYCREEKNIRAVIVHKLVTGSWSKGRNRYYAYYHCQDGCTRETKDAMEGQFEEFMRQLQPNAGYMRLYRDRSGRLAQKTRRQSKNAERRLAQDRRIA